MTRSSELRLGQARKKMHTTGTLVLAIGFCAAFLAILSLLHVLEPEFNPPHLISEYQLGRFGWLMSVAFFCLGAAALALFGAARQETDNKLGRFGVWGLLIISVSYFLAATFAPDPEWLVGSVLHGVGGLVVIFGSPIVFTLLSKSFARNGASARAARPLIWTTALTWLSLLSFYESILALRVSSGSSTVVGWTNRFLIMTFVLWLLIAAVHLWKRN